MVGPVVEPVVGRVHRSLPPSPPPAFRGAPYPSRVTLLLILLVNVSGTREVKCRRAGSAAAAGPRVGRGADRHLHLRRRSAWKSMPVISPSSSVSFPIAENRLERQEQPLCPRTVGGGHPARSPMGNCCGKPAAPVQGLKVAPRAGLGGGAAGAAGSPRRGGEAAPASPAERWVEAAVRATSGQGAGSSGGGAGAVDRVSARLLSAPLLRSSAPPGPPPLAAARPSRGCRSGRRAGREPGAPLLRFAARCRRMAGSGARQPSCPFESRPGTEPGPSRAAPGG